MPGLETELKELNEPTFEPGARLYLCRCVLPSGVISEAPRFDRAVVSVDVKLNYGGEAKMTESNDVRGRALKVIYSVFEFHNSDKDSIGKLIPSENTTLFGQGAVLDSFELVRVILSIERGVDEEFGVEVTLADEKAMSQRSSPFRSVETLASYIVQLMEEGNHG